MGSSTRYAKTDDGVYVAYQESGAGPLDIVVVAGFVSNVELDGEFSLFSGPLVRRLGRLARVIQFDKRGTGLSDRDVGVPSLEHRMDDLKAVMDAVGVERAALVAASEAGPMAALFAATHPSRTTALVLMGSFARLSQAPDQPFGYPLDAAEAIAASFEERWGSGRALGALFPSAMDDPALLEQFARYERNSASPSAMRGIIAGIADIDVRAVLPTITAPTLVIHRSGDPVIPVECGKDLAARIPNARYVELAGGDHLSLRGTESEQFDVIREFLTGEKYAPDPDRVLATVLFTDVVGSTEKAAELGDSEWNQLLDRHDAVVREGLQRFRGREVNTTGDGFVATFDGPARAVQCALAVTAAVRSLGIELRAGLHTGECEVRGDDLGGIAVHLAARICAAAGPSEVMVSRTIPDLTVGSGLHFADRGEYELKGLPGRQPLYLAEA